MKDKSFKPYYETCFKCNPPRRFLIKSKEDLYEFLAHKETHDNGDKGGKERVKRIIEWG